MFYGGNDVDGITGKFWIADFKNPPIDTDWFVELSCGMKSITGKNPSRSQKNNRRGDASGEIILPKKCGTIPTKPSSAQSTSVEITSLAESLDPLKDYFNANKDRYRFVALLSPT